MPLAELIRQRRSEVGLDIAEFAKKMGVPVAVAQALEEPTQMHPPVFDLCAAALGLSQSQFLGETPVKPLPSPARQSQPQTTARFGALRSFILDPCCCTTAKAAREVIGNQENSLLEQNIVLFMATNALYYFCNHNTSAFAFDDYLFTIHNVLLNEYRARLEKSLQTPQEREEQMALAAGSVFYCDTVEHIAIRILDQFSLELEKKIGAGIKGFESQTGFPFVWELDEPLMRVLIRNAAGDLLHEINLLDPLPHRAAEVPNV